MGGGYVGGCGWVGAGGCGGAWVGGGVGTVATAAWQPAEIENEHAHMGGLLHCLTQVKLVYTCQSNRCDAAANELAVFRHTHACEVVALPYSPKAPAPKLPHPPRSTPNLVSVHYDPALP